MNYNRLSHFSFNYADSGHQRDAGGCEPVAGSVGAEEQRRDVFHAECECGRQQDSGPAAVSNATLRASTTLPRFPAPARKH